MGSPDVRYDGITLYGTYKQFYQDDKHVDDIFDVDCKWDSINEVLELTDLSEYTDMSLDDFKKQQEDNNEIIFEHFGSFTNDFTKVDVSVSYGATMQSANILEEGTLYDITYFPVPIIVIHFTSELGENSVGYDIAGGVVMETGEWFLEADRNNYTRYFFYEAEEILGIDE